MDAAKPFIVIGAGGHAKVVIDLIRTLGGSVLFATDTDRQRHGGTVSGAPIKGGDDEIEKCAPAEVRLAIGVGISGADLTEAAGRRPALAQGFVDVGYEFPPLVHPGAIVAGEHRVDTGAQVMAGAVLQSYSRVDRFAIVNTRASVDHDSAVGAASHIGPGATVCGGVTIGSACYVGSGATIVNDIIVTDRVLLTAGSTLTRSADIPGKYAGTPARLIG